MFHVRHVLVLLAVLGGGCLDSPTGQFWPTLEVDLGAPQPDASPDTDVIGEVDAGPDLAAPQPQPDGAPCAVDAECSGGVCLTGEAFPGGFCSSPGCPSGCPAGSNCSDTGQFGTFCAPECTSDTECREGYGCRREGRRGETPRRMCTPIRGLPDGEACAERADCQGGFCLPWPGGYCTTTRCQTSDDCSNLGVADNVCLGDGGFNLCVRRCAQASDCREGYLCTDIGGGELVCLEDPARPFDEAVFAPNELNIQCGIPVEDGRATIPYEIADNTTSYMITPMSRDGQPIEPWRILLPDATEMNFVLERLIFTVPASFFASMNPTLVPAGPSFTNMLAAGSNQYVLGAEGEEICYYVLEKQAPGAVLDLNVYLVDVPGVSAATAATHPDFIAVFDEVRRIYEQIGITLGEIRFRDIGGDAATRFGVLRSDAEVGELVKLSTPPGDDLASLLSVNVFFVGEFAMRGVIGISSGLPGPAGLHGTHGSGVVFTAEYMGAPVDDALGTTTDGNAYTALLLAHEVGHWLGLFHTTEQGGQMHDPLADTPQCSSPENADRCPDWGNLMFPFAAAANTTVTADQGFVLSANPATHPAPTGTP